MISTIFWQNTNNLMMTELSLNILDVAENSIRADADYIEVLVSVDTNADTLVIEINDNGCGMSSEQVERVLDPFYTTRTTRRVGLGVPFFRQAAESTGGSFAITSEEGKGTKVKAVFGLSHIDRMPLGDINATVYTLVVFHETIDWYYKYTYNDKSFVLHTQELKEILGDVSLRVPEVSKFIREYLDVNKAETDGGAML